MEVAIKSHDRATADAAADSGTYTMALVGYGGVMADPDFLRERYSSKSKGRSFSRAYGYSNSRLDELAAKQLITLNANDRREIVAEMQQILADDLPVISLYVPYRLTLYNQRVLFDKWYYTPGCSPCRGTRNKHMFVTGKKNGF
jgi:peptide/nickel transport system substrate-binding protein